MNYTHKAYLNATGKPAFYILTHDIKRCLADSKATAGLVNVLSTSGTTGVILLENAESIKRELLAYLQKTFEQVNDKAELRRSGSGPDRFHLSASLAGLSLTLPFQAGRLMSHSQHEVFALDLEPKPGRREFIITVQGEGGASGAGGPPR